MLLFTEEPIAMSRSIRPLLHFLHIIGALLLAGLLSGCSALQIGYNNAPSLTYWWLDSYVDFNEAQSPQVRADLAALHAWHRKTELPAYAATLRKLQQLAPANVRPEQVCDLSAEVRGHLQRLSDRAEPAITALAPALGKEQLDHLARQFEKRNRKWREEWLEGTPAQRQARRIDKTVERAEMFYGRLDEAQLAVIRNRVASSSFDAQLSYREALRRQQDMLQTLKEHAGGAAHATHVKAEILALLERSLNSPDATYRRHLETMVMEGCQTIAALHNSTTPAQRLRAIEVLQGYETDARTLAAEK